MNLYSFLFRIGKDIKKFRMKREKYLISTVTVDVSKERGEVKKTRQTDRQTDRKKERKKI